MIRWDIRSYSIYKKWKMQGKTEMKLKLKKSGRKEKGYQTWETNCKYQDENEKEKKHH